MNRVRQPFNVNLVAQTAAIASLKDDDFINQSRLINNQGREQLEGCFREQKIQFIPSCLFDEPNKSFLITVPNFQLISSEYIAPTHSKLRRKLVDFDKNHDFTTGFIACNWTINNFPNSHIHLYGFSNAKCPNVCHDLPYEFNYLTKICESSENISMHPVFTSTY